MLLNLSTGNLPKYWSTYPKTTSFPIPEATPMCLEEKGGSAYSDNDTRKSGGAFNKTQSQTKIAPFTLALEAESFSSGDRCFRGCLYLNKSVCFHEMAACNCSTACWSEQAGSGVQISILLPSQEGRCIPRQRQLLESALPRQE